MKVIKLPIFDITVVLAEKDDDCITHITSKLDSTGRLHWSSYKPWIRAIEQMILNHAILGIDITVPAYVEGIKRTVDKWDAHDWAQEDEDDEEWEETGRSDFEDEYYEDIRAYAQLHGQEGDGNSWIMAVNAIAGQRRIILTNEEEK